jgi:hypothetical protein
MSFGKKRRRRARKVLKEVENRKQLLLSEDANHDAKYHSELMNGL